MKKYKYYICNIDNSYKLTEEFHDEFDMYQNMPIDLVVSLGIQFYCDIPSENGYQISDNYEYEGVLSYNKLGNLIEEYIFESELSEEELEEIDKNTSDFFSKRYLDLLTKELVLKQDKKTKLFSLVSVDVIDDSHNKFVEKTIKEMEENDEFYIELENFDELYEEFIQKIESKIESEICHITASGDGLWDFLIVRENSDIHKALVEEGITDSDEKATKNGFIYECGFDNFQEYVYYNLSRGNSIGVNVRIQLSKYDKDENPNPMSKVYGIVFHACECCSDISLSYLTAKEILNAHTINAQTGESIDPDNYTIYCGDDPDDIILGFELI